MQIECRLEADWKQTKNKPQFFFPWQKQFRLLYILIYKGLGFSEVKTKTWFLSQKTPESRLKSKLKVEWKQNGYSLMFLLNIHDALCKGYCLMTMVSHPRPTLPLTARESPSSSSITCVRTFPLGSPSLIVSEEANSYIMAKLEMAKNIHLQL